MNSSTVAIHSDCTVCALLAMTVFEYSLYIAKGIFGVLVFTNCRTFTRDFRPKSSVKQCFVSLVFIQGTLSTSALFEWLA